MNGEIKNYVLQLLESYPERTRKIALLRYELEHPSQITSDEIISAMNTFSREEVKLISPLKYVGAFSNLSRGRM